MTAWNITSATVIFGESRRNWNSTLAQRGARRNKNGSVCQMGRTCLFLSAHRPILFPSSSKKEESVQNAKKLPWKRTRCLKIDDKWIYGYFLWNLDQFFFFTKLHFVKLQWALKTRPSGCQKRKLNLTYYVKTLYIFKYFTRYTFNPANMSCKCVTSFATRDIAFSAQHFNVSN